MTVLSEATPIAGPDAGDFRVRQGEVGRMPLTVDVRLPPLSVVLAVDTSGSMSGAMEAGSFVATLAGQDRALVLGFAREVTEVTDTSSDTDRLAGAIGELAARGDTALSDALIGAAEGRRAIVLPSDGAGNALSKATVDTVVEEVASVKVPIFGIGLGDEFDIEGLHRIAAETGGRFQGAGDASELDAVYESIGSQLGGQYSVAYTSSLPADGTMRRVDVKAAGQRASKSYTPDAGAVPASVPALGGDCAPLALFESYLPDHAEIMAMDEVGLIDGTVRCTQVKTIQEDLYASLETGEPSSGCVPNVYAAVLETQERETMDNTTTDQMIRRLSKVRGEACIAGAETPKTFCPALRKPPRRPSPAGPSPRNRWSSFSPPP